MASFNPNAYGKPVRKTHTRISHQVDSEAEPVIRERSSATLLQSRWSKPQRFLPEQSSRQDIADNDNKVNSTIKPKGNVVVQSVSLLSSPRQPANTAAISKARTDSTINTIGESKLGESIKRLPAINEQESRSQSDLEPLRIAPPAYPIECDASKNQFVVLTQIEADMAPNEPSNGDKLRLLQGVSMNNISRKVEGQRQKRRAKLETSSLNDLYLARKAVDASRPEASERTWAENLPHSNLEANPIDSLAVQTKQDPVLNTEIEEEGNDVEVNSPNAAAIASKRSSRWPNKADMKARKQETDSNAWGSDCPSDATRASNVSNQSFGKLLNKAPENRTIEIDIRDWEGNWMPAPADWHDRPRYNNNNENFKDGFQTWLDTTKRDPRRQSHFSNGLPYTKISKDKIQDVDNHPDGISMVDKCFTIKFENASRYGYTCDDREEHATKYAGSISPNDFEKWDRLNLNDHNNVRFQEETTKDLVDNWLRHSENARKSSITAAADTINHTADIVAPVNDLFVPEINIYLRPATEADIEELTRIYNLHVVQGVGPTETSPIAESDMLYRMNMAANGQLPFIVAAKMNQKGARLLAAADNEAYSRQRGLPVQHRRRERLSRVEILAGFASAMDFTAADFVERTSAELEIYVDPSYKRRGVGTCLLDKLLEICDRGHQMTTNCDFHCASDVRHLYQAGGDRNLHKMYFLLRKWHFPKPKPTRIGKHRKSSGAPALTSNDFDYDTWLKAWMESFDFEIEGTLQKVGAKNGRYVDLVYLGRGTDWSPPDGHVPPPDPRHVISAQDLLEDESEDEEGVAI